MKFGSSQLVSIATSGALALVFHIVGGFAITPIIPYLSTVYPGAAFQVVFGMWFGFWGAVGVYIGTVIGGLYFGWPIHVTLIYMFVNFFTALIPAVTVRALKYDAGLKSRKDYAYHLIINAFLLSAFTATWGTWMFVYFMKWIGEPWWWPFWIGWYAGNVLVVVIISTLLLRILTGYIKRTPLYTKGLFR